MDERSRKTFLDILDKQCVYRCSCGFERRWSRDTDMEQAVNTLFMATHHKCGSVSLGDANG